MKKISLALTLLLGLIYFVFGLNGFLHFIPTPPMEGKQLAYFEAMMSTQYFFPLLKGTETLCGLALLSGCYVPLALIVLAPITLNIVLYHAFMAPENMYMQVVMIIIHLFLAYNYKDKFKEILKCK